MRQRRHSDVDDPDSDYTVPVHVVCLTVVDVMTSGHRVVVVWTLALMIDAVARCQWPDLMVVLQPLPRCDRADCDCRQLNAPPSLAATQGSVTTSMHLHHQHQHHHHHHQQQQQQQQHHRCLVLDVLTERCSDLNYAVCPYIHHCWHHWHYLSWLAC